MINAINSRVNPVARLQEPENKPAADEFHEIRRDLMAMRDQFKSAWLGWQSDVRAIPQWYHLAELHFRDLVAVLGDASAQTTWEPADEHSGYASPWQFSDIALESLRLGVARDAILKMLGDDDISDAQRKAFLAAVQAVAQAQNLLRSTIRRELAAAKKCESPRELTPWKPDGARLEAAAAPE